MGSAYDCYGWLMGLRLFVSGQKKCRGENQKGCGGKFAHFISHSQEKSKGREVGMRRKEFPNKSVDAWHEQIFSYSAKSTGHSRLQLRQIVRLVYMWLHKRVTLTQMEVMTGLLRKTVVDWTNFCREVFGCVLDNSSKLVGTDDRPV